MTLTLLPRNRSGWIEIVEAFVAVLLVAGVLLVVLNKQSLGNSDISDQIYTIQLSILREIETNSTFRTEIVGVSDTSLPVSWENSNFPVNIKTKIMERTPNYLNCVGQICDLSDDCVLDSSPVTKNIYAQEVTITSTLTQLGYRKMKLFCWEKRWEALAKECNDGTVYESCSTTKPKYCNNGELLNNCGTCGCPTGDSCQIDGTCKDIICEDGTISGECSTTVLKYCDDQGKLVNNCAYCNNCPSGQKCNTGTGTCYTPICSDGTVYGSCSVTKPKYCSNGNLINNCNLCGCPLGQACVYSRFWFWGSWKCQ